MRNDRFLALSLKLSQNINTKMVQRKIRELFESAMSELNMGAGRGAAPAGGKRQIVKNC